jgi:hypothetical protein
MTKRELEIAIPVVIGEVIEKCLYMLARAEGEEHERILEIARNAELLQSKLSQEIDLVKNTGSETMSNPQVLRIMEILNNESMKFHVQLERESIINK